MSYGGDVPPDPLGAINVRHGTEQTPQNTPEPAVVVDVIDCYFGLWRGKVKFLVNLDIFGNIFSILDGHIFFQTI